MRSSNNEKADPALAGADLHEVHPAATADAFTNTPITHPLQHLRRIHRKAGISRSEERHRLTRPRAEALAEKIRVFWAERGVAVRVWVEPVGGPRSVHEFTVRSNLSLSPSEVTR